MIDDYFGVLTEFNERVERMDSTLLRGRDQGVLLQIQRLKRDCLKLRRALMPMREMLISLNRGEHGFFKPETLVYLRDAYDHTMHVIESLEMSREMVGDMLDLYLSTQSHRLNLQMRVLTVLTMIFMPLTLIAGIYGMNFEYMPELKWHYGYHLVLVAMLGIAGGELVILEAALVVNPVPCCGIHAGGALRRRLPDPLCPIGNNRRVPRHSAALGFDSPKSPDSSQNLPYQGRRWREARERLPVCLCGRSVNPVIRLPYPFDSAAGFALRSPMTHPHRRRYRALFSPHSRSISFSKTTPHARHRRRSPARAGTPIADPRTPSAPRDARPAPGPPQPARGPSLAAPGRRRSLPCDVLHITLEPAQHWLQRGMTTLTTRH